MATSSMAGTERVDLAAARRSLTQSAGQALTDGRLNPDDLVKVRLTLKRGRSCRASVQNLKAAAKACLALAAEFDRRTRRAGARPGTHRLARRVRF